MVREVEKFKRVQEEVCKGVKLEKMKLGDDVKEFKYMKEHFEMYKAQKIEAIQRVEMELQRKTEEMEEEFQMKQNRLVRWEEQLRA